MSLSINDFYNFDELYDINDEVKELCTIVPQTFNFIIPSKYIKYNGAKFVYDKVNNKLKHVRSIKYCIVYGCKSQVAIAKKCMKHHGYYRCKVPGCNKRSQVYGVCTMHGGFYTCVLEDCSTRVKRINELCTEHLIKM